MNRIFLSFLFILGLFSGVVPLHAQEGVPVHAQEKVLDSKRESVSLAVDRLKDGAGTSLKITLTTPTELDRAKVKVFEIADPSRLVIDLTGLRLKKNETFPIAQSPALSAIRLGTHPDKARVVLDLSGSTMPEYSWETSGPSLVLTMREGAGSFESPAPTPAPPVETVATKVETPVPTVASSEPPPVVVYSAKREKEKITPQPTPAETIVSVAPLQETAAPEPTTAPAPTIEPTSTPIPAPTLTPVSTKAGPIPPPIKKIEASPGQSVLSDLEFDYTQQPDKIPVIKVILSGRPEYNLVKIDDRLFKLTIPGATLAATYLALPQFPPHDFLGFTYVEALQHGDNIEVSIGVERGIKVASFSRENQIWIRALNK